MVDMTLTRQKVLVLLGLLMAGLLGFPHMLEGQQVRHAISGVVYEALPEGKRVPLPGATVAIPEYGIGTASDASGRFRLRNVPEGEAALTISYVGKVKIDTLLHVDRELVLSFTMQEDNFSLQEVVVTATPNEAGQATSSKISASAMEHLQAVSLSDLMGLLPGGITTNPTLSFSSQFTIRNAGLSTNTNALGTAIVQDGAPLSNNANLQATNPIVAGSTSALAGGAAPSGGIDLRGISLGGIESVEVIRGIPSVEHGDLTSGAVLITSRAGSSPLLISAKTNPNVVQAAVQKGIDLGANRGALNVSLDYARNVTNPTSSYQHYSRYGGKLLYSNTFLDNMWRTNSSLTIVHGVDRREPNPDDEITRLESRGQDTRLALNTNGTIYFNGGWLRNIRYVLSASYNDKHSYRQEQHTAANAPYSMTSVDGAILANAPGKRVYDGEGREITKLEGTNPAHFANFLPSTYLGRQDIYGKELSFFAKLNATFAGKLGATRHRLLLGADFRSSGNIGRGKEFDPKTPPYRILWALNATFRPRPYSDIPFMNHLGLYAEENFSFNYIDENNEITLQPGVRWDYIPKVGGVVSPRVNASMELIPNQLYLRGGYGLTAKMPTLLYLYPEKAYFEYINVNELASSLENPLFMTTTRIFDTENKNLRIAKNRKAEVGLDWRAPWGRVGLTLFSESLKDGYSMYPQHRPVIYHNFSRVDNTTEPLYQETGTYPVLASYYAPDNTTNTDSRGMEWEVYLRRIEAIRTSFTFTGGWIRTESYSNSYAQFDRSGEDPATRTHVALYEPKMRTTVLEKLSSALRATHNIPELGLVLTLTSEVVWFQTDYNIMGNDTIPIAYISKIDGKQYPFDTGRMNEPEFATLLTPRSERDYIAEIYPPLFNFNVNLTKEIGDFMRVSFFANNMFRSYPKSESKRNPGSFNVRNKDFFFGLELNIFLP